MTGVNLMLKVNLCWAANSILCTLLRKYRISEENLTTCLLCCLKCYLSQIGFTTAIYQSFLTFTVHDWQGSCHVWFFWVLCFLTQNKKKAQIICLESNLLHLIINFITNSLCLYVDNLKKSQNFKFRLQVS